MVLNDLRILSPHLTIQPDESIDQAPCPFWIQFADYFAHVLVIKRDCALAEPFGKNSYPERSCDFCSCIVPRIGDRNGVRRKIPGEGKQGKAVAARIRFAGHGKRARRILRRTYSGLSPTTAQV